MADTKISALTELDATPDDADVVPIVDDPGGTPASKKITVANLLGAVPRVLETLSPSDVTEVDITLPTGYEIHELVGWVQPANDGANLWARFSNDGGSTFREGASDYAWTEPRWHSTTALGDDQADTKIQVATSVGSAAGERVAFKITIFNARASGVPTYTLASYARVTTDGDMWSGVPTGRVHTAEDNDALRLLFDSGNIAAGEVRLIGCP